MSRYLGCLAVSSVILTGCSYNAPDQVVVDPDYTGAIETMGLNYNLGSIVDSVFLSGNSSIALTKESPYGLTVDLEVQSGELYVVSMYRREHNPLVSLVADGEWEDYYYQASWPVGENEGWQEISLRVEIPEAARTSKIRFYAYNVSSETCHVDSLVVKRSVSTIDTLLPDFAFYPLLFDIINDYHVRHIKDVSFGSILRYSTGAHLEKLYRKHGTTQELFSKTFYSNRKKDKAVGMQAMLHKMKQQTHRHSVAFNWEASMNEVIPAGYIHNMFLFRNETAHISISGIEYCKGINLNSLGGGYQTRLIKELQLPVSGELTFACNNLSPGIYQVELVGDSTKFHIPLIVNDTVYNSVVVVAPYTTWHAYNDYGGKSFYRNNIDKDDVNLISTLRPVTSVHFDSIFLGHDIFILRNIFEWYSTNYGANLYPDYWLEAYPDRFQACKTIVLAQHCEYFSSAMLSNLVLLGDMRNLVSLGANQIYWKVKWDNDFTLLECRKDGIFFEGTNTPGGLWRNELTSEARILGVAFTEAGYGTYGPYGVTTAAHWLYDATKVKDGDAFGESGIDNRGLSGDEMDKVMLGSPANVEVIAKGKNPDNGGGEIVLVDRGQCATFSCGSIACGSGLGKDKVFTKIIENFMDRFH